MWNTALRTAQTQLDEAHADCEQTALGVCELGGHSANVRYHSCPAEQSWLPLDCRA